MKATRQPQAAQPRQKQLAAALKQNMARRKAVGGKLKPLPAPEQREAK